MVGIQGIGGVPEPRPDRAANVRDNKESPPADDTGSSAGVVISSEAQAAPSVAKSIQASQGQNAVCAERIEAAREAIERGDFKKPDIVTVVAERLRKLL